MDTSETYIEQCRQATELQQKCLPGNHSFVVDDIILFRQDELQDMLPFVEDLRALIHDFYYFISPASEMIGRISEEEGRALDKWLGLGVQESYIEQFNSMEQLWISYVMWELYSKKWERWSNGLGKGKMVFLDKYGYPIEKIKGRWFSNLIRTIFYCRNIKRGKWDGFRVVRNG